MNESLWNGHINIIGCQFGTKFKLVFCAKYDRGLDLLSVPLLDDIVNVIDY